MEVFEILEDFLEAINKDARISVTHISLYLTLLKKWKEQSCRNPVEVVRNEIMNISKIRARHTYYKCIRELDRYGYIRYYPSPDPSGQSLVYIAGPCNACTSKTSIVR